MSFATDIHAGFADLLTEGGEAATYNGAAVTVLPQAGNELVLGKEAAVDQASFLVAAAEVPSPAYRAVLVVAGTTWLVLTWRQQAPGIFLLNCRKNERPVPR
jgi:hypothetical protein